MPFWDNDLANRVSAVLVPPALVTIKTMGTFVVFPASPFVMYILGGLLSWPTYALDSGETVFGAIQLLAETWLAT